jgi:YggT family protein
MAALQYIAYALLQMLLVTVFLMRVLFPLVRADSRNQLSQAVIRLTNPLVMPLRRILPPIRKVDTASLVALLIAQIATTATLWLLGAYPFIVNEGQFIQEVFISLATTILRFYTFALLLLVLLSWVAPGTYSPAAGLLSSICEPVLRPVRRIIPLIAGIDLSALFLMIGLQALSILINTSFRF